jgi:hypothetical protein
VQLSQKERESRAVLKFHYNPQVFHPKSHSQSEDYSLRKILSHPKSHSQREGYSLRKILSHPKSHSQLEGYFLRKSHSHPKSHSHYRTFRNRILQLH